MNFYFKKYISLCSLIILKGPLNSDPLFQTCEKVLIHKFQIPKEYILRTTDSHSNKEKEALMILSIRGDEINITKFDRERMLRLREILTNIKENKNE